MDSNDIRARLEAMADKDFAAFSAKLMPTVPPETVIGVRTPDLRRLAADLWRNDPRRRGLSWPACPTPSSRKTSSTPS